ncbi:glycosyltransferase [bacterium]|nr:glycosyltransferase [bacterium]
MKNRILFVTSSSDIGGTERQLLHLLAGLDRNSWEPAVYSLVGDGELLRRAESLEVRAEQAPQGLRNARHHFAHIVREFEPKISHIFGLRADLLARRKCKSAGATVISGIRNTDPWRRWWHVWLDRVSSFSVDLFVSNSQAGRQSRIQREGFSPSRIVVIPNGIELPETTANPSGDGIRIGLVGNYRHRKGHDLALKALARILPDYPDARLVFAGVDFMDGELQKQIASLNLDDHVEDLGFQEDVASLLQSLDLYIQPSRYEGTPNTLMEAMATGLPCIASEVGGVPEVLRDEQDGILIPPEDEGALAAAMKQLMADETRRKELGSSARKRIEEAFSMEALVARHDWLYKELLKGGFRPELRTELEGQTTKREARDGS